MSTSQGSRGALPSSQPQNLAILLDQPPAPHTLPCLLHSLCTHFGAPQAAAAATAAAGGGRLGVALLRAHLVHVPVAHVVREAVHRAGLGVRGHLAGEAVALARQLVGHTAVGGHLLLHRAIVVARRVAQPLRGAGAGMGMRARARARGSGAKEVCSSRSKAAATESARSEAC